MPLTDSTYLWGPVHLADGSIQLRLWAPAERHVSVVIEGHSSPIPLTAQRDGWHSVTTSRAPVGSRYRFQLEDGTLVPDPATRFQPEDTLGPSEVIDPSFPWRDRSWRGMPWHTAVIQRVHVGAFTPAGTFAALSAKIPHLADLGITALQLMPVGDFPGRFNWGRDGVLPYAPDASYGRPEQLKALVDKAHDHGLMMFLEVGYRHLATEPAPLRQFILENALYWLDEFHFDGLRLDAEPHILAELERTVRDRFPQRHIHLMAAVEPPDDRELLSVLTETSTEGLSLAAFPLGKPEDGERFISIASPQAVRAACAIQLLSPRTPLLFMGEEWEATEPFPFFSDSSGSATGRAAFQSAKLDWSALRQPDGTAAFERYQKLLAIRRNEIAPRLPSITSPGRGEMLGNHSFRIEWAVGESELLVLEANLSARPGHVARKDARRILWAEGECAPGRALPPWSVLWLTRGIA